MNNYPLFYMDCVYVADGKREQCFVVDFYKEEEVLKFSCIEGYPVAEDGRRDVTNEDIINYCNNPLSERKVISSEDFIKGSCRFLECKPIRHIDDISLNIIAKKMYNQGIIEDDFKEIPFYKKPTLLQRLRERIEKLKEGD